MVEYLITLRDGTTTINAETKANAFRKAQRRFDEDPRDVQEIPDSPQTDESPLSLITHSCDEYAEVAQYVE